jgi:hypothetical protein
MKTNGSKWPAKFLLVAIPMFAWALPTQAQTAPQQPSPAENTFTEQIASQFLRQMGDSLQGHSQKQFLALFDLTRMKDGPIFKQQIAAFFSQTESIRVHLNLVETPAESDKATFAVDAEMEVQPLNGARASRRSERLTFTAAKVGDRWKLIDVQPRSFFSLP